MTSIQLMASCLAPISTEQTRLRRGGRRAGREGRGRKGKKILKPIPDGENLPKPELKGVLGMVSLCKLYCHK